MTRNCLKCKRKTSELAEDGTPLCSFCKKIDRKIYAEKMKEENSGYIHIYCRNCGVRMTKKSHPSGYCTSCEELKAKNKHFDEKFEAREGEMTK